MASYTDLWKAVSNVASNTAKNLASPITNTLSTIGSLGSSKTTSPTPYTPTSSSSNSNSGYGSIFPFASAIGAVLNPVVNKTINTAVNKALYEDPNKNYEGYAQDIINGKITSNTTYDQWAKGTPNTSYPGGSLNYGGANGSNVPSFNISFPGSSSTTSTYDPDEASRRAQAQVDEYYKQQQDLANQQAAANRTSQLARLRAAYDTQRADINSQIPELEATAQQALTQNENDYYNKYKPQMLAAMEQSGGYKGGQMVDNMQGLITALQNNQNNVNTTKLQQEAKLRQALANLNTQQASDETQVNSNIDASTYDKLMSALQNSQQQKITLDQMYNDNAYKQATFGLQQQQMAYDKADRDNNIAMERAKLTGYLDPHPGMQLNQSVYDKYGSNLQAEIDRRKREGDPEGLIPQLEEWRYQKVINDPGLINKYGGMYQTIDGRQQQAQDLVKQISLAAQYDPRIGTSSFMGEYQWVISNPKDSLDHVLSKADLLKNEYGENGYNILLSIAKLAAGSV